MKKIAFLLSFLALTASAAFADDFTSKLDLQLLSGTDIPTSTILAKQYTYGYHFGMGLGYRLSDDFSVMATFESHTIPSSIYISSSREYTYTVNVNELALQLKYMVPTGLVRPYVFGGAGLGFVVDGESYYAYEDYQGGSVGFLAEGGVGVNLPVNDQLSAFVQTKASFVWWDKNVAAYWGVDDTLAYVPVQLGLDLHI